MEMFKISLKNNYAIEGRKGGQEGERKEGWVWGSVKFVA